MCVSCDACICDLPLMSHDIVRMALIVATAHDTRTVTMAPSMPQLLGVGSSSDGMGVACKALVIWLMCTWHVRLMCDTRSVLLLWRWGGGLCASGEN